MAEFFKVFPCPTDKLIIPFIRDFKNLKKEVLTDLIDNSVRHMSQLDLTNVNLDNGSVAVTLYPKVRTDITDSIKVYQSFFKMYDNLRYVMCQDLTVSVVYRDHVQNHHISRKEFNKNLNLILLLVGSMDYEPDIVDISIFEDIEKMGRDYRAIDERIRGLDKSYILGTAYRTGTVGIEDRIDDKLTQRMYTYYHKNKKHFDGRLGKLPSTPWYCE